LPRYGTRISARLGKKKTYGMGREALDAGGTIDVGGKDFRQELLVTGMEKSHEDRELRRFGSGSQARNRMTAAAVTVGGRPLVQGGILVAGDDPSRQYRYEEKTHQHPDRYFGILPAFHDHIM
jgi:hypothetical protein